ncbi:MAG: alpha/beta hydrolase [Dehalococcoidales bacterium]
MISRRVVFPCGEIQLEGILHLPEDNGPSSAVIVCHPHPLYGGDMDNNVVTAVCNGLGRSSIASLRFNFRGVGNSGGRYSEGLVEQDDLRAALNFLFTLKEIDSRRIGLAGYSFGGMVANAVAMKDNRVKQLALISPALERTGWAQLKEDLRPKLIIIGDADTTVAFRPFQRFFGDAGQYQIIAGADHFWSGFEEKIGDKIARFFHDGLQRQ